MADISRIHALALAGLCVACWPLSAFLLCLNYTILLTSRRKSLRASLRQLPGFRARRVLITGSTPAALRLARAFHETGHHVTVAAYQPTVVPLHVKWSVSVPTFLRLRKAPGADSVAEYVQELLAIVERAGVEIWIDATGQTSGFALSTAKSVIERKTNCVVFGPNEQACSVFTTKATFLKYASSHGLPVPESYEVKSRDEIHRILNQSRGKQRYILSETNGSNGTATPTRLPRRTPSLTYDEVARIKILQHSRLRLDQTLEDGDIYRSVSVVVHGNVEIFTACKIGFAGASHAISPTTAINEAMLQFHQGLAGKLYNYNGHLAIDFCVDEKTTQHQAIQKRVLPVAGQCAPDSALLYLHDIEGAINLVRSYISVFGRAANGFIRRDSSYSVSTRTSAPTTSVSERGIYAFGPAMYFLVLMPVLGIFKLQFENMFYLLGATGALANQVCFWQEAIYDFNDPLPFFYFYFGYAPLQLIWAVVKRRTRTVVDDLRLMSS